MRMHHLLSLLLLSLVPLLGLAQVYSWKDANGKIHYGDRPPADRQSDSRKLAAPPPATDDADAARKAAAERKMTERENQQKTQETEKKTQTETAEAKRREEGCRQAKANLAAIESGEIRFTVNAQGERVGLDDGARTAEIAKARKVADSWCKPPAPAAK